MSNFIAPNSNDRRQIGSADYGNLALKARRFEEKSRFTDGRAERRDVTVENCLCCRQNNLKLISKAVWGERLAKEKHQKSTRDSVSTVHLKKFIKEHNKLN